MKPMNSITVDGCRIYQVDHSDGKVIGIDISMVHTIWAPDETEKIIQRAADFYRLLSGINNINGNKPRAMYPNYVVCNEELIPVLLKQIQLPRNMELKTMQLDSNEIFICADMQDMNVLKGEWD